ncbi:hypothetical protein MN116_003810 [Schistosoma mekongi]|uniref:Uncharacterized protein n=1 Tax=Schistosoma mekongi TaxID=38744 RepID=A0AAE2D759_SCHME|nr:hypothetical protein MN116_003810 [Schistosoma mekongi]
MVDCENIYQKVLPTCFQKRLEITSTGKTDEEAECQNNYNLSNMYICKTAGYETFTDSIEINRRHEALDTKSYNAKSQTKNFKTEFLTLNKERINEQLELEKVSKSLRSQLETASKESNQEINKTSMESKQSEMQFQYLKCCVDQLLEANAEQERLICAMNEHLEASNKKIEDYKSFVRCVSSAIRKFDPDNKVIEPTDFKNQEIEHIRSVFNKFLQIIEEKQYSQTIEIEKMKTRIDVIQSQHKEEILRIEEKHQSTFHKQCEQLQDELNNTIIRAEKATQEARTLRQEVANARSKYEEEIIEKRERIQDLEKKLINVTSKQNNSDLISRKELESLLDTTQKEMIKIKCERDSVISQLSTVSTQLETAEILKIIDQLKRKSAINKENKLQTKRLQKELEELKCQLDRFKATSLNNQRALEECKRTICLDAVYLIKYRVRKELMEQIHVLKKRQLCSEKCLQSKPLRAANNERCTIQFRASKKPSSAVYNVGKKSNYIKPNPSDCLSTSSFRKLLQPDIIKFSNPFIR